MEHFDMKKFPLSIDTGLWDSGHIQGIAVDPVKGYIYYSYTTILVKARLDGTVVGWAGGLFGQLGCIDFNDENGKVYGSLEYKHDTIGRGIMNKLGIELSAEDAFYIAIFDVDKIDRPNMDAAKDGVMKAVYMPEVVAWYDGKKPDGSKNSFTVSGIDGLSIGPVFGAPAGSETRLMLCSGIYENPEKNYENDYHTILQFDWRELDRVAAPLSQLEPHHIGLSCEKNYFLDIAKTTWGIQNLEYDALNQSWIVAVYRGKKEGSPNLPMYVIDGTAAPVLKASPYDPSVPHLTLRKEGIYHEATDVWGLRFPKGQTGAYAFGNGYYYFSYDFTTPEKLHGSTIRLCIRTDDPECPFAVIASE